jgi:hypothetical protein
MRRMPAHWPGSTTARSTLSHAGTEQWIERTEPLYITARTCCIELEIADIIDFVHNCSDPWQALSRHTDRNDDPAAAALPRAIFDMVDRMKAWKAQEGLDGAGVSRTRCQALVRACDDGDLLQRLIGRRRC